MATAPDPRRMSFPKLAVKPREPRRVTLRNGLPVYLLADRSLPVVTFEVLARTGSVHDPADQAGLASMTATAMRLGGSKTFPGDRLDEELDRLGADLDAGMEDDLGRVRAWSLSRHAERMVGLAAGVLRQPAFPDDKIELTKARELELILRRWDQPSAVANLQFRRALYGPDDPWGRLGTAAQARSIAKQDLLAFHAANLDPRNMTIAAAGDFDEDRMRKWLDAALGDWEFPAGSPPPKRPDAGPGLPPGTYLTSREVGQLNFRIGHRAIRLNDPDWFALRLMDMILGNGTFNSRLFRDIRTERGLAYAIWSRMQARARVQGTFHVGGETKYETSHEALTAIIGHMKSLRTKEVTASEMKLAKEQLEHSLAFEFQSSWEVARRAALYEHYDLPKDWLMREREGVLAATAKQIKAACGRHLHPDRLTLIAVGDPKKAEAGLKKFGPITPMEIPDRG